MPITRARAEDEAARLIETAAETLPQIDEDAFAAAFDAYAGAQVVLLGEATHGTAEFYRARAAITRRLIERHGFSIVAVEADWPDAAQLDAFVRGRNAPPLPEPLFSRFPAWMWRNAEVRDFLHWLRRHNADRPMPERAEFRGLDLYSLGASIAAVLHYLDREDPEAARAARQRYGCLTPWQAEPSDYGLAVLYGRDKCEQMAIAQLRELLAAREMPFDAVQNARVVRAAEQYYRAMYRGSNESWNLRDRHMFDTLRALLDARPGARAVVWAHNSHIGNAAATAMGWSGQFNIGKLCRTAWGDEAVLIGFGTDRGTVAAASAWGGEMELKAIRPARDGSHEALFRDAAPARSLTRLTGPLRTALAEPRLERAIGVIYRPDTELASHYFEAVLPEQFDAWVWFAQTHPVTPLPGPERSAEPELFPFGV
ncbi:MAG: erythromycin esterase family protein [Acetobacteraceae bacterium]|nr:erythromycin esterase family protein [Acetobacteraceae bacterium]